MLEYLKSEFSCHSVKNSPLGGGVSRFKKGKTANLKNKIEQRGLKKQQYSLLGKLTKTSSQNCGEPMEIH